VVCRWGPMRKNRRKKHQKHASRLKFQRSTPTLDVNSTLSSCPIFLVLKQGLSFVIISSNFNFQNSTFITFITASCHKQPRVGPGQYPSSLSFHDTTYCFFLPFLLASSVLLFFHPFPFYQKPSVSRPDIV